MEHAHRVHVWVQPRQIELLRRVMACGDVALSGITMPDAATGPSAADSLGCTHHADLRLVLTERDFDLLWLLAPDRIGPIEYRTLAEQHIPTLIHEPRQFQRPDGETDVSLHGSAELAPLMRRSAGGLALRQVLDDFGEVTAASFCLNAAPDQGTVMARLYDALDLARMVLGDMHTVSATMHAEESTTGSGDTIRRGQLAATFGFEGDRCASMLISNTPGPWNRTATFVGPAGRIEVIDDGCDWQIAPSDDGNPPHEPIVRGIPDFSVMVHDQMIRQLEQLDIGEAPSANDVVFAWCETTFLSCRTGQTETPEMMLRLLGVRDAR